MLLPSSDNVTESAGSIAALRVLIDRGVRSGDTEVVVRTIQRDLAEAIRKGQVKLERRFYQVKPGSYARRLLFRNAAMGYTVVIMTWAPGQRTPIHDHAGIWCVEGVVRGQISVTRYRVETHNKGASFLFSEQVPIRAGVGSTGCLIPPDEYHVLANTFDSAATTLHIYGGEMDHCNVYAPRPDGWHERTPHWLAYDP
jgi:predicted metal-dependent enzyme (double-stranded beta helix superfamily)